MESNEVDKSVVFFTEKIVGYESNSTIVRTIVKKITGNVWAMSFDTGEGLKEKVSPFDSFVQIVDGKAEIVINGISSYLVSGQCIIIPAHSTNELKATERFKMILTVIKSGYE